MTGKQTSALVSPPNRIRLWDVYRFAYQVALRSIHRNHVRHVARLLWEPCTYWRNLEVPEVLNQLQVIPAEKILDIGSPKLASLFLCYRLGADVSATDLFPYFFDEYSHYCRCLGSAPSGGIYRMEVQDGRNLAYSDSSFDKVFAISVIEHIEDDGDSRAMQEIARVLKPGGACTLTVPFDTAYRETTIRRQLYYKKHAEGGAVFYQRHYDPQTLRSRLISPSGLQVRTIKYFGERWFPYEGFYGSLPSYLRIPLALLGPLFSRLFLHPLRSDPLTGVKTTLLTLQKRGTASPEASLEKYSQTAG